MENQNISEIGTASQKTIHFNVLEIPEEVKNSWYKFKPLFKERVFISKATVRGIWTYMTDWGGTRRCLVVLSVSRKGSASTSNMANSLSKRNETLLSIN